MVAQGVSKDCIFNEAFGHVFKSAVGAVELPPVGVGVGIDRNQTSPARLSEWNSNLAILAAIKHEASGPSFCT